MGAKICIFAPKFSEWGQNGGFPAPNFIYLEENFFLIRT